jgi:hypothetical protein
VTLLLLLLRRTQLTLPLRLLQVPVDILLLSRLEKLNLRDNAISTLYLEFCRVVIT